MSGQADGTRGHPIHGATSRGKRRGGHATALLTFRCAFSHSTSTKTALWAANRIKKKREREFYRCCLRGSCLIASLQFWCLPGQFTMRGERWNNPSFRAARVGWLGVTRHRAADAHWLAPLWGAGLSFNRLHSNASQLGVKAQWDAHPRLMVVDIQGSKNQEKFNLEFGRFYLSDQLFVREQKKFFLFIIGCFLPLGTTWKAGRTISPTASKWPWGVRKQFSVEHFLPFVHFRAALLHFAFCHLVADSPNYSLISIILFF